MPTLLIAEDRDSLMESLTNVIDAGAECFMLVSCTSDEVAKHLQVFPQIERTVSAPGAETVRLLRMLKFPPHREGYKQLCIAIPLFAKDTSQSLSKEVYPAIANMLGYSDGRAVERSIRNAILSAWERRDPTAWSSLFPEDRRPPSNKCFISALAELIK